MHRAGVAVIAMGFEAPTSNFASEGPVLDSRSVAVADADPTGVGARQARRLEEENDLCRCAFYARKISTLKLAGLDKYFGLSRRPRCAMVIVLARTQEEAGNTTNHSMVGWVGDQSSHRGKTLTFIFGVCSGLYVV